MVFQMLLAVEEEQFGLHREFVRKGFDAHGRATGDT